MINEPGPELQELESMFPWNITFLKLVDSLSVSLSVAVIDVTKRPVTSHIYWSQVCRHTCDLGIYVTTQ